MIFFEKTKIPNSGTLSLIWAMILCFITFLAKDTYLEMGCPMFLVHNKHNNYVSKMSKLGSMSFITYICFSVFFKD